MNDSDDDVGLHVARLFEGTTYEQFKEAMEANQDLSDISETILWLNRDFEGEENRGQLSETVVVSEGVHSVTCVIFDGDGPPVAYIHVGTIPATAAG